MDDPRSRKDAFCSCVANFCRRLAVFRARVAQSVRMLTQVAKSERSLENLKDPLTLDQFGLHWPEIGSLMARLIKLSQIEAVHHFLLSQRRSCTHKLSWGLL